MHRIVTSTPETHAQLWFHYMQYSRYPKAMLPDICNLDNLHVSNNTKQCYVQHIQNIEDSKWVKASSERVLKHQFHYVELQYFYFIFALLKQMQSTELFSFFP